MLKEDFAGIAGKVFKNFVAEFGDKGQREVEEALKSADSAFRQLQSAGMCWLLSTRFRVDEDHFLRYSVVVVRKDRRYDEKAVVVDHGELVAMVVENEKTKVEPPRKIVPNQDMGDWLE